jgi:hypothetical protein
MAARRIEIVGAGLAGLVAGTCLAREGFEVVIHERQAHVGGRPAVRPDPAGSPFDLERLAAFTGIDISPACRLNREFAFSIWGRRHVLRYSEGCKTYMVERGARESSLDSLLLREARAAGVSIRHGDSFDSPRDFDALPSGSIITVGLEEDGYRHLGVPSIPLYGYYARGKSARMEPEVCLYFDSYTKDYGFTSNINGCCFAFLIGIKGQVADDGAERFRRQVEADTDYRLHGWQTFDEAVLPHASPRVPRLFHGNRILAGTAAGMMDPVLYFGMLGAMVSGRIAATAVTNPALAEQQFRQATANYRHAWRAKALLNRTPDMLRRRTLEALLPVLSGSPAVLQRRFWRLLVPGYDRFG